MKTVLCWRCNSNCVHALRIPKDRGYKSWCLMIGMKLISCPSLRRGIGYSTLCTEIDFFWWNTRFAFHLITCCSVLLATVLQLRLRRENKCMTCVHMFWFWFNEKFTNARHNLSISERSLLFLSRNVDKHTMSWLNRSALGYQLGFLTSPCGGVCVSRSSTFLSS